MDNRPDTKPEMRLMLGSSTDVSKQVSSGNFPHLPNRASFRRMQSVSVLDMDVPYSTMFLMDYRWRLSSQSCVVRVQQPLVLVVPDFLLAIGEFFVPALGTITGREEAMDPKKDPICRSNSIVLSESVYKQREDVVHLSPSRQLIVDAKGVDEYTYDGCGKVICLSEETNMKFNSVRSQPIIIIGRGKRLKFVNIKIEVLHTFHFFVYYLTFMQIDISFSFLLFFMYKVGIRMLNLEDWWWEMIVNFYYTLYTLCSACGLLIRRILRTLFFCKSQKHLMCNSVSD